MFRHSINIGRIIGLLLKESKSNEELDFLQRCLAQFEDFNKCTQKISKLEKIQLLRSLSCKSYSTGEVIFSKGEPVQSLFIVLKGIAEHISTEKGTRVVTTYSTGRQICDKSYMRLATRTSTCIAMTDCVLLDISLDTYREILGEDAHMLLHKKLKFIDQYFPGIKKYSFSHRERIAHMFEVFIYKRGQMVLNQGDSSDFVYFLCDGEVELTSHRGSVAILKLTPGSSIGEEALMGLECQHKSIVSSELAILYALSKSDMAQYVPDETREALKRNFLLKDQERKRLNINVGRRLEIFTPVKKNIEFTMASPQARKQLNIVTLRSSLSTSQKDFRDFNSFLDSKKILVQLRRNSKNKRPATIRHGLFEL